MTNIRDKAQKILDDAVPEGKIFRSNENPPSYVNAFSRLTGTSHLTLMANWQAGGYMTACNGFVNWYARTLGIKDISNWFKLKQSLVAINKGYAWVASTANGPRPKYGDILQHKGTHVDVAIGFKGNILRRAAAGQCDGLRYCTHPRPPKSPMPSQAEILQEYDVLMRVSGQAPYDWQKLEGWLDIDLYFGSTPQPGGQVPQWLIGWWNVTWRNQTYYYYFDNNYEVKWTQILPYSVAQPPVAANDTGDFTIQPFGVATRWRTTGSVEQFSSVFGTNNKQMQGMCNGTDPVTAVKM
jgi:hypothetical protein